MSRLVVAIGHVEFTGGSQVLYVVKVQQDADEWEVRRTYSDFRKLRDDVQRVMKDARAHILDDACSREFARELQDVAFPAKRLFGSRKDHVVKERAVELHRFLIKLLFLTHTYRKAQKARYDQYVQALPSHQQAAYAALQDRTQASVSVFYLLRDFLKPVTIKTDVPPHSGDLLGSSDGAFQDGDAGERESSPRRLIRESKILAMRSSNPTERKHPQSSREATREADKMQQHQRREQQVEQRRREQHKHKSEAADPANDSGDAAHKAPGAVKSTPKTAKMHDLLAASERFRAEANSLRQQFLQKQHSASVAEESLRDQFLQKQHSTSALANEHRKQRHFSTPDGNAADWKNRTTRAVTSVSTSASAVSSAASSSHDESEPEKEKVVAASSVPSSASSTVSASEVKLVDLSSLAQYKTKKSPRRDSHSSDKSKSSQNSNAKEKSSKHSKEKKTSSRIKRKAKSAKNIQMTDSERMSRVSSALNAQAISINAQRELEKYITEYSAIMILRYVDRFVNKAVMKAPGCYRVNAQHRLVIDSQRFLQEIEETFTDLPINFGDLFQTDHDEWAFPPALDRYVQLKWDSFQSMGNSSISHDPGRSSTADQTSDSDDSDTEYEYEEVGGGGYMTAKQTFSNDEESMLQEMIANGTAGREQMLRLRRQLNEQGWNRRENPGSRSQRVIEEVSSSESDEEEALSRLREKRRSKRREPKRSVSCVVEKYQQEQNARRKDRLQSFGGPKGRQYDCYLESLGNNSKRAGLRFKLKGWRGTTRHALRNATRTNANRLTQRGFFRSIAIVAPDITYLLSITPQGSCQLLAVRSHFPSDPTTAVEALHSPLHYLQQNCGGLAGVKHGMMTWNVLRASCGLSFLAVIELITQTRVVESIAVSVCQDATFRIPTSRGRVCSGNGNQPLGVECPRIGDEALDECFAYLASFDGGNCVAKENAQCVYLQGRNAWGCTFPSTRCSDYWPATPEENLDLGSCPTWGVSSDEESSLSSDPFDVGSKDIDQVWFSKISTTKLYNCNANMPIAASVQEQVTAVPTTTSEIPVYNFAPDSAEVPIEGPIKPSTTPPAPPEPSVQTEQVTPSAPPLTDAPATSFAAPSFESAPPIPVATENTTMASETPYPTSIPPVLLVTNPPTPPPTEDATMAPETPYPTSIPSEPPATSAPTTPPAEYATMAPETPYPTSIPSEIPATSAPTTPPTEYATMAPETPYPASIPSEPPATSAPTTPPTEYATMAPETPYPTSIPSEIPATSAPTPPPTEYATMAPETPYPTSIPSEIPATSAPTPPPTEYATMAPETPYPTSTPSKNPATTAPTTPPTEYATMAPETPYPTSIPSEPPATSAPTTPPTDDQRSDHTSNRVCYDGP
ncbi:unnamed protein product [Phytophthora fragariaefolia]|uniref:Unnamed protein product n=1 Tax=Phytophthora fragariaefolia TaxID=1490495 RepID=A0A9W6X1S0_9STRA|nr:unnamed protein product [Phytophthora fragariaefolia]